MPKRPMAVYTGEGRTSPREKRARSRSPPSSPDSPQSREKKQQKAFEDTLAALEAPRTPMAQIYDELRHLHQTPPGAPRKYVAAGPCGSDGSLLLATGDSERPATPTPLVLRGNSTRSSLGMAVTGGYGSKPAGLVHKALERITAESLMAEVDAEIDGILGAMGDVERRRRSFERLLFEPRLSKRRGASRGSRLSLG